MPFPDKAMPKTSVRQFIEFAVNIPEHDPQPGHAEFSISHTYASSALPDAYLPTASKTSFRLVSLPLLSLPGIMGPPEHKIAGRLILAAAISMPGTILSQFGIRAMASNPCAITIVSTVSATSSREAKE